MQGFRRNSGISFDKERVRIIGTSSSCLGIHGRESSPQRHRAMCVIDQEMELAVSRAKCPLGSPVAHAELGCGSGQSHTRNGRSHRRGRASCGASACDELLRGHGQSESDPTRARDLQADPALPPAIVLWLVSGCARPARGGARPVRAPRAGWRAGGLRCAAAPELPLCRHRRRHRPLWSRAESGHPPPGSHCRRTGMQH